MQTARVADSRTVRTWHLVCRRSRRPPVHDRGRLRRTLPNMLRNCGQAAMGSGPCENRSRSELRICACINEIVFADRCERRSTKFWQVLRGSTSSTRFDILPSREPYLTIRRFEGAAGGAGAVAAAWLTLIATPPALNTAEREFVPVFAAIVYVAVPEPVRDPVMVAHVAFDDVDHEQFDEVVTVIVPLAPEGAAVIDVGDTENVHGAAAWVTVNVCPPIVIVPVRDVVFVFAATL